MGESQGCVSFFFFCFNMGMGLEICVRYWEKLVSKDWPS